MENIPDTLYIDPSYGFRHFSFVDQFDDFLVYKLDPFKHYEDWTEDGGVMIVKYNPLLDEDNGRFTIVSFMTVRYGGGFIRSDESNKNIFAYSEIND